MHVVDVAPERIVAWGGRGRRRSSRRNRRNRVLKLEHEQHGIPPGTPDFRAPGLVLGLLVNLVGAPAAGLQPTLAGFGVRFAVEYDPGYFTEENDHNSHVFMRIFLPPGAPYPAHALAQPGASPFHDTVLFMLKLQNPVPAAPPGAAPPPAPPPGHDPFWRYIYYMH